MVKLRCLIKINTNKGALYEYCKHLIIRKTNGTNYTEPHHLIPLSEQDNFEYGLDVPANIVSLCSNCHNQLHYGLAPVPLLTKLYEARKDELKAAGIEITLVELITLYK